MKTAIHEYSDYKQFLGDWLRSMPSKGRGKRTELAEAMRCKLAYVSQVLNGDAQLSLEQGEALARYFAFSRDETEFLLFLVQKERAGTENLRQVFESLIDREREKRKVLKDRIGVGEGMSELDRARYYSAWHYTAIHILLTIPQFQTRAEIAKRLRLAQKKVADSLDFLVKAGLATQEGDRFLVTRMKIHLGNDSPEIIKHHSNWRMRATIACEDETPESLHYSSVVSLAKNDISKIKEVIVSMIEEFRAKIDPSKEEELFAFCVDWFRA
ncbi:MAG: TIGR02147 family protein [Bdellovibrionota bacterium]